MTTHLQYLTLPSVIFDTPAISVLLPIIAGTAVGYSTRPTETQATYLALKQPPLRPPPAVFGPVWTVLYGCMGYAAHRAWNAGVSSLDPTKASLAQEGATLYTIQLGLNLIWMPLFFHLRRPIEASLDIFALTAINSYLTYTWWKVDGVAGWLLVPYLGWLSFATYLSIGAGYLNNWDFSDKESSVPPSAKPGNTKWVDEKP